MNNLQRVETDEEIATRNGFKLAKTLYALGTRVNSLGDQNYQLSRNRYEELPLMDELAAYISNIIKEENRSDDTSTLQLIYMSKDNTLLSYEFTNALVATEWAHDQLIKRCKPYEENHEAVIKAAAYASDPCCPQIFSSDLTNYYLQRAVDKRGKALKGVLRTRDLKIENQTVVSPNLKDARQLFAVVSERYNTECDTDVLIEMVRRKVEASKIPAKVDGLYDGRRFKMSLLYHSDIETPVVGELFKAGVTIESADDGSRSISITPMVMRNLCLNFMILDRATQRISLTHLRNELYDAVSDAIDVSMTKVAEFGERWAAATKEKIFTNFNEHKDPEEVFVKLVKLGHVKLYGLSRTDMVSRLFSAWQKEPGYMKSDIINAISRTAHQFEWSSPWIASQLEEQAGKLVYSKLVLDT